jgi:tetratricopeptide (TPR) repeat protein
MKTMTRAETVEPHQECRPVRHRYIPAIKRALELNQGPVKVVGPSGSGKEATVRHVLDDLGYDLVVYDVGRKDSRGYFAGFSQFLFTIIAICEVDYPSLIERHEHSLKRLFPLLTSPGFRKPKDLTNTAPDGERTRFYHYEYQNKLLHDVASFVLEYCRQVDRRTALVISDGDLLPKTSESFFNILARGLGACATNLTLVILLDEPSVRLDTQAEVYFAPVTFDEAIPLVEPALAGANRFEIEMLWRASNGNAHTLDALVRCYLEGIRLAGYFSDETMIDFYLLLKGEEYRRGLLDAFIDGDCESKDPIAARNYKTSEVTLRDALHRSAHERALLGIRQSPPYTVKLIHALSLSDPQERLRLLSRFSKMLQHIGLYDTWMDFFSPYYIDDGLRRIGSGEDECNAVFISAAFVLYSMGLGKLALPYLENFYQNFPTSRYVPTALYAQSMTYGRYQIPVNLDRADHYATLNLRVIDTIFRGHEQYNYVRVFAENALAYIRAKQGKLEEALRLCTDGIKKMREVYGERFKLHQSILIYNTGQVYELLHRYDQAEQYYLKALEFDPFYGEYYNDLANLLAKIPGRENDALAAYGKAISLCPSYYEAYLNRGMLYARLERFEDADRDLQSVLDIKPEEYRAHFALGNLYLKQQKVHDAFEAFERAERYNNADPDLFNNQALCRSELGDHTGAIALYAKAIGLKPDYADAYNNMAISCVESGDPNGALRYIRKAIGFGGDEDYRETERAILKAMHV